MKIPANQWAQDMPTTERRRERRSVTGAYLRRDVAALQSRYTFRRNELRKAGQS